VDKLADFAEAAGRAGEMLRDPAADWREVEHHLIEPVRWLSQLTLTERASIEPFLLGAALEAVTATWVAIEAESRTEARLAVERLRQTLNDLIEQEVVGATTPIDEVVRWIDAQLFDVETATLAHLAGTSPRSWQRWLKGDSEPVGPLAQNTRALARVVAHLRHALTPAGCVSWLTRPHPELDNGVPAELLRDPESQQLVIDLAAGTRISAAA
jgi:uncharacterized protein (DUF2384 family)